LIHFTARFGRVHAIGYDSAVSDKIWSTLSRLHCRLLGLGTFGRDPRSDESWGAKRKFLSGKYNKTRINLPTKNASDILRVNKIRYFGISSDLVDVAAKLDHAK